MLLYEFKTGLADYLEKSGAPIDELADVIAFNKANAETTMPFFGQDILERSDEKGPLTDDAYLEALELMERWDKDDNLDTAIEL